MNEERTPGFGTLCVAGVEPPAVNRGAVTTPVVRSSTFAFEDTAALLRSLKGEEQAYFYSRLSNPTVEAAEKHLALLEKGEEALLFPSGMGALSCMAMGLLQSGDEILSLQDVYGGSFGLFTKFLPRFGIGTRFVKSLSEVSRTVTSQTRMLFVESPTNPLLRIHSLRQAAELGKRLGLITVIDNTFATPCLQNPLEWGFDLVVHSATKYLGGHSDVLAGVAIGAAKMIDPIRSARRTIGINMGPDTAWLLDRGIKTLSVRMERHCSNAMRIAAHLEAHPNVKQVWYPGLASHPEHRLACQQMKGFGGVVSFEPKGNASAVVDRLQHFLIGASLGGVESLVAQPIYTCHYGVDPESRRAMGIADDLIRLSVGIEDVEDLITDLDRALEAVDSGG